MKKMVLIATMLYAMLFCGGAVYADNTAAYTGGSVNTATITDTSDYSTVIITKASDDPITNGSIVYVNQAKGMFNASMDFMLKANPDVGKYNVVFGAADRTTANTTFYIGVNSNNGSDVPMTRLSYTASTEEGNKTYYTAGFSTVINCDDYEDYNTLKVGYNNGTRNYYGGFPLNEHWTPPVVSGEGDMMLVFVLDHIEEDELPTVSVFLSEDDLNSSAAAGSGYVE